jgi:hypothetical protein
LVSVPVLSASLLSPPHPCHHSLIFVLGVPLPMTTMMWSMKRQRLYLHRAPALLSRSSSNYSLPATAVQPLTIFPQFTAASQTNLLVQKKRLISSISSSEPTFTPPSFTISDRLTGQLMPTVRNETPAPVTHARHIHTPDETPLLTIRRGKLSLPVFYIVSDSNTKGTVLKVRGKPGTRAEAKFLNAAARVKRS